MNTADQNADHTDELQRLAYAYWEKRGRPLGSPEDDWFRAKEQLEPRTAQAHTLMRYSLKMVSGLVRFIGKALPLILGIVLVIFVGLWMWVWMVGGHGIIMHALLDGLPSLAALLGKALLLGLLLISATAFTRVVGSWMVGGDTITIVPFTDTRADSGSDKGVELGHTIIDAFISQIHRINQLHTLRNPWGSAEEPPLEMAGPQAYERVGTVSFVGIELPVGELVLALRAVWPSWHTRYVITGSLQRCLSGSATRGQLVARLEEDGRTRKHWSYELPLNNEMLAFLYTRHKRVFPVLHANRVRDTRRKDRLVRLSKKWTKSSNACIAGARRAVVYGSLGEAPGEGLSR